MPGERRRRVIFGGPGEENLDIMNALFDSSIKFITTRHEQGAAFMADVYGRLTGKAGVCLATLGPGATNLLTGSPMQIWIACLLSPSRDRSLLIMNVQELETAVRMKVPIVTFGLA